LIKLIKDKKIFSWALYDWANSTFATTVMVAFFPIFFKKYWASNLSAVDSTFYLGSINSFSSLILVIFAPLLGSFADLKTKRKVLLFSFCMLGCLSTVALFFVQENQWQIALLFFFLANFGFAGGNIFYDSLITFVSTKKLMDKVSAFGFALGYLGGGVLLVVNVLMITFPSSFGLADKVMATKYSFLTVGVWWAVFSIPVFLYVKEYSLPISNNASKPISVFANLKSTFLDIKKSKYILTFLLAYWLYIDAVDTIIKMSVDYGMALGIDSNGIIKALLLVQFIGFPAAIFFGWLGSKIGAKKGINITLIVYLFATIGAMFMSSITHFFMLAAAIGLVQGGVQSLSRSLFAKIIPYGKSAEYFSFYNMMGKSAAIIGPLLVGLSVKLTNSSRVGMVPILLMLIVGFILLQKVKFEASINKT